MNDYRVKKDGNRAKSGALVIMAFFSDFSLHGDGRLFIIGQPSSIGSYGFCGLGEGYGALGQYFIIYNAHNENWLLQWRPQIMGEKLLQVTDGDFEDQVVKSDVPVLVDFWAPWCGACVAIGPVLEALSDEYQGKVKIVKMNVNGNANIPASIGVRSIPFMALFNGGKMVDNIVGAVPKTKIVSMLDKVF